MSDTEAEGSVLLEAQRLVYGERQQAYDHPINDFTCTADMLNAYFTRRLQQYDLRLPFFNAEDVGMIQIIVKLARQSHRYKRDNLVDISGYAETVRRVHDAPPLVTVELK